MNVKAIVVAAATTAGIGVSGVLAAAPAQAGTWQTGGDYSTYAQCDAAGEYKIEHRQAVQYSCDNVRDPWEPALWRLHFLTP